MAMLTKSFPMEMFANKIKELIPAPEIRTP